MTITEGLQEIKTLTKRVQKKREFIDRYLYRSNSLRDPHESSGGSIKLIAQELQAIEDLESNIVTIRQKITDANKSTVVTIGDVTKSIAEWLIWRREIANSRKRFLESLYDKLNRTREECNRRGLTIVASKDENAAGINDVVVNINEKSIVDEIEQIEEILSTLDGKLSLKNATTNI